MSIRQGVAVGIATVLVGMASGCTSEGEKAERAYEIVKADEFATADDRCRAAQAAKAAYLSEGEQRKYKGMSVVEDRECIKAQLDRMSEAASQ